MIQFIHTADIHFGMENYGKIDPTSGIHSRLLDFSKALHFCIDYAIEQKVDFFLFSGDAYKTPHPSQTHQRLLIECFLRLYKAHIPVVIIVGNHDHPLSFGKTHALDIFSQFPVDGFTIVSKPTTIRLETMHGPVQIVGIPWPTRNNIAVSNKHLGKSAFEITEYISKAVAQIIKKSAQELDPSIPAVLAGHLTVSSGVFSGSEKRAIYGTDPMFLPSQLAMPPFDYVGLGHLHRYQNLNKDGYPAIVYSGSIERVDFGERKEEKGFCHVQIEEKGKTTHTFIKTPTRPFIQIEVRLKENEPQTEQIIQAIEKENIKDAIVKILYHVPAGRKDTVDLQKIQYSCNNALQLVSIQPIRTHEIRERRLGQKNLSMDLPSLLSNYFERKSELKSRKEELIKKALILFEETDQIEQE